MSTTLSKALVALIPACLLFCGSVVLFLRARYLSSALQLVGAGCLVLVAVAHVCEGLGLFPWMYWGMEHSAGHYLDFICAVLGLTLFPVGYLLHAIKERHG